MSIFSFFLLRINFINIVTRLIVNYLLETLFYHYDDIIVVVGDGCRVVWYGVGWLGWLGGTDDNNIPIMYPSPLLFMYKERYHRHHHQ